MKKFWKIYSWLYLVVVLYGIFSYAMTPIAAKAEATKTQFAIAYSIASLFWLIPVFGIFLYAYGKQKFMFFWKVYFLLFTFNILVMLAELFTAGKFQILFPFHLIALFGLFQYCFKKNNNPPS